MLIDRRLIIWTLFLILVLVPDYALTPAHAVTIGDQQGTNERAMDEADFILPKGLIHIGPEAFRGSKATVVQLQDGVVSIGDWAFADCEALRQIRIPASVISIGNNAFYGCRDDLIIFGAQGSAAESYANGRFTFIVETIDDTQLPIIPA